MSRQQPKSYPLYNTTYTLHRVSPLYTEPLTPETLYHHAYAFRNLLVGDNLRGVQIGLDPSDMALTRVGALQSVSWRLLGSIEEYDNELVKGDQSESSSLLSSDGGVENGGRGVRIHINYERAEYTALLLRRIPADSEALQRNNLEERDGFIKYPVLAARMPAGLRQTLIRYLQENFDVRVSPLNLDENLLITTLDTFLERIYTGLGENRGKKVVGNVLITFAFSPSGSPSQVEADDALKSIDITIAADDVYQFTQKGEKIEDGRELPFWEALKLYVRKHMAMDISHEAVRVGKIACGAWVLGREGKMKIFEPKVFGSGDDQNDDVERWIAATEEVVESIIGVAQGGMLAG